MSWSRELKKWIRTIRIEILTQSMTHLTISWDLFYELWNHRLTLLISGRNAARAAVQPLFDDVVDI